MLPYVPTGASRILDVGCGTGMFALACREATGCECWGVELVPKVAEQARPRLEQVFAGDANHILPTLPNEHFDMISFTDVLEHIAWPEETLRLAKPLLRPGGVVVASLPNIVYWDAIRTMAFKNDFPYSDSGIFDRTHLRFFTRKSIPRLFDCAGYAVLTLDGINPSHSPKLRLLNLLTFNRFADFRWLQYAVVARPTST